MTDSEVARLVEMSEARAYADLINGAPNDTGERYALSVHRVGSAYALVAANFCEALILNRVIGLGVCEPATEGSLDMLKAVYLDRGVAIFAAEIGPGSGPPDLLSRLGSRGFVPFKRTAMLYRRVEPISRPSCDFRVSRVGRDHAALFADLTCEVFRFDEPFPSLLRATFDSPAWQHWMAFDGARAMAAAITHIVDDVAWIGWVGTLPEYRGRGAQSAITAAQLHGASENECRWVTLETVTGTNKRPSQSLRNYRRLGWNVAYDRFVYVHKPAKPDAARS